jgi:hypothetical protein
VNVVVGAPSTMAREIVIDVPEAIAVKCLQVLIGGDFPHTDKITSTKFRTWPPSSSSMRLLSELSQAD